MIASIRSEPMVGERMETTGVDWGPKGLILVHREGSYGIYKIPGHKTWGGNFQPWYYTPTRYGLVEIEEFAPAKSNSYWGRLDLLYRSEVTPGASWRSAIADLKNEVRLLASGDPEVLDYHGIEAGP